MRTTTFTKLTSALTLVAFVVLSSAAAPNTAQASCDGGFFCSDDDEGFVGVGEDMINFDSLLIGIGVITVLTAVVVVAVVANNNTESNVPKGKGPRRTPASTRAKPANASKARAASSFMIGAAPTADGKGAAAAVSFRF